MARRVVDWEPIRREFEWTLRHRKVSLRQAAKEMGLPPTTLARVRKGKPLNADGLVSLLVWFSPKLLPWWTKEV